MLEPVADAQPAMRAFDRLAAFPPSRVGAFVPEGFERYARILHPGRRASGGDLIPIKWADMAAYTGSHAHRLMAWKKLAAPAMLGCEVFVPDEDDFPDAVSAPLEELLLLHAHADCHQCWLGVWRGWGGHGGRYDNHVPQPTWCLEDEHGQGRWDLFRAPLRLAFAPLASDHTANLVWADDGSWWLNKGIDLHATYIGGSAALIDAVLQSDALEAWPAELDDDVTSVGDRLNGRPGRRRLGRGDHGKPWALGFRAWRPPGDSRPPRAQPSVARSTNARTHGRSVEEAQAVSVMAPKNIAIALGCPYAVRRAWTRRS